MNVLMITLSRRQWGLGSEGQRSDAENKQQAGGFKATLFVKIKAEQTSLSASLQDSV